MGPAERRKMTIEDVLGFALELIPAIREFTYTPSTTCPRCRRSLTLIEILWGFRDDPHDYTTKCPECETRFSALITCRYLAGMTFNIQLYCRTQTLELLRSFTRVRALEISRQHQAVYHSAIFHFGCLKKAFEEIGIEYRHEEILPDWKPRIRGFLGKVPDQMIASTAGVSVEEVATFRDNLGIEPFPEE